MVTSAAEARLRITGDSRQAVASMRALDKGVINSAKGIRGVAAGLRTLGTLSGAFFAGEVIKRQIKFDEALDKTSAMLGLTGDDAHGFRAQMENLKKTWVNGGGTAEDFAAVIVDNARAIRSLRGDGSATQKMMLILERAMALSKATGADLGTTVSGIARVVKAYNLEADDAAMVTDTLTKTWDISGDSVENVVNRITGLAPAATAAGVPLSQVATLVAGTTSEFDGYLADVLALTGAMGTGNSAAVALASQIGLTLKPGETPNAVTVFDALNDAIEAGINIAPNLKAAIDTVISKETADRIKGAADDLERIEEIGKRMAGAAGATDALNQNIAGQTDESLVGRIREANRANNELPEMQRLMNGLFGRSEASAALTWLTDNIGDSWHNVRQGQALPLWQILPQTPTGTIAPSNEHQAPGFRVVNPDGSPMSPGSLHGQQAGPIHIDTLNLNGAAVKDGQSFVRTLGRELESERIRIGSGRR